MITTTAVDELRDELRDTLARSEAWLRRTVAMPDTAAESLRDVERDAEAIGKLRTRAASTLINVALLGAFSSGKSFLLSGIQGGLELVQVQSGDGSSADKFVGLLPSAPVPANACPASVVPVGEETDFDASGSGYLRVRFVGSGEWEDVGNSPVPSMIAAYVMQDADVADRLRAHRDREVAEIQISISDHRIPAKLYDLPGYGSPNAVHDAIVKAAVNDADCFIYISNATRSLSENDLDLIRFLYDHYLVYRKKVIWVVTAIDLATQLDHRNIPAWQATIDRNNAYLRENFTVDGKPDIGFIGEGFIPVSPASEARAISLASELEQSERGRATVERYLAEGRMDALRRILTNLIDQEAGRKHIATIADQARSLIIPKVRTLTEHLQAERLPIDELEGLLTWHQGRLQQLKTAIPSIRKELEDLLQEYVARASRPFNGLPAHLHSVLDSTIRSTDVHNKQKANQILNTKNQALRAWMEAPIGPATVWDINFARFKDDALRLVESGLGSADHAGQFPDGHTFDINDLTIPSPQGRRTKAENVVQQTAALIGISAPIAATAAWTHGVVATGLLVFPPTAAVLGASVLVYMIVRGRKNAKTSGEVTQQEWICALDEEAASVQEHFEMAVGMQGMDMINTLVENLFQYQERLEASVEYIRERMARPETQERQELVGQLEPLCEEGSNLEAGLRDLAVFRS